MRWAKRTSGNVSASAEYGLPVPGSRGVSWLPLMTTVGTPWSRMRARPHDVGVQVDPRRHRERRLQVGHEALAGHERLDLGAEGGDVLLGGRAQDRAVLLVGQAEHEERVELAQQLAVEQLGLLGH